MSNLYTQSDYRNELRTAHADPLLPIEKRLISWSLGIARGARAPSIISFRRASNYAETTTPEWARSPHGK